jgi:hypothetical protein
VQAPVGADDDLLLREADLPGHLAAQEDSADSAPVRRTPVENASMFGSSKDKALQAAVARLAPAHQRSTDLANLIGRWRADLRPENGGAARTP